MGRYQQLRNTTLFTPLVSAGLIFNANSVIFQIYHGENKWIFDKMMKKSALYYRNTPTWIFRVKQQSADRHVATLEHIILIPS